MAGLQVQVVQVEIAVALGVVILGAVQVVEGRRGVLPRGTNYCGATRERGHCLAFTLRAHTAQRPADAASSSEDAADGDETVDFAPPDDAAAPSEGAADKKSLPPLFGVHPRSLRATTTVTKRTRDG